MVQGSPANGHKKSESELRQILLSFNVCFQLLFRIWNCHSTLTIGDCVFTLMHFVITIACIFFIVEKKNHVKICKPKRGLVTSTTTAVQKV